MKHAAVIGTGFHVPDRVVTNEDLTRLMDTSDAWITERSGIKERRWVAQDAALARMASESAGRAAHRGEARFEIW